MTVLETLLSDLPSDWRAAEVYVGANWVLSLVEQRDGEQRAGIATAPSQFAAEARFHIGHDTLDDDARTVAQWLGSADVTAAAVGLATLNALNRPDERLLTMDDAADWLAVQCAGRSLAIFGRFPFIDAEVRPLARQVWVFEQHPQGHEFDSTSMRAVLPQADVVAITGSSIVNHTIDVILPHVRPDSTVVLLGPSTPLSEKLFGCGIDALFGVQVANVAQAVDSVIAGDGFQKMRGLQRVALFKSRS